MLSLVLVPRWSFCLLFQCLNGSCFTPCGHFPTSYLSDFNIAQPTWVTSDWRNRLQPEAVPLGRRDVSLEICWKPTSRISFIKKSTTSLQCCLFCFFKKEKHRYIWSHSQNIVNETMVYVTVKGFSLTVQEVILLCRMWHFGVMDSCSLYIYGILLKSVVNVKAIRVYLYHNSYRIFERIHEMHAEISLSHPTHQRSWL